MFKVYLSLVPKFDGQVKIINTSLPWARTFGEISHTLEMFFQVLL